MLNFRWLPSIVRFALGFLVLSPVVALPITIVLDRGPSAETRISPHVFPLVLWLFDDFAWTCALNSLIFATIVSLLSLGIGGVLAWMIGRRRFLGRGIWRGLIAASLGVAPAFLALGLTGLRGPSLIDLPHVFGIADGISGTGLGSGPGILLWAVWIWSTLPWGVGLATLMTTAALEQLKPSWEDSARLAGAGKLRAWCRLSWPLIWPAAARASALVFVFALAEPGAPLVLGLRRTLAFQIVEAALRADPFPQAAVWALVTGIFGLLGWTIWRWAGGTPIAETPADAAPSTIAPPPSRPASPARAVASFLVLAAWTCCAWLPIVGLVRIAAGHAGVSLPPSAGAFAILMEQTRWLAGPEASTIIANSALLGIEVSTATLLFVAILRPARRHSRSPKVQSRLSRRFALMPPLVQGVGLLAVPWLAGLASAALADRAGYGPIGLTLGRISTELDPRRNPWIMLSVAVVLVILPRFQVMWPSGRQSDRSAGNSNSAVDAARIAGASPSRAFRLARAFPLAKPMAGYVLVWSLAATNLSPALLFEPWSDGLTIAPAIVQLATGPVDARPHAALLALCAITASLTVLAIARVARAQAHSFD